MKPSETAQALRKIADRIDASKLPHASAVEEELQAVVTSIKTGADRKLQEELFNAVLASYMYAETHYSSTLEHVDEEMITGEGGTMEDVKAVEKMVNSAYREYSRKSGRFKGWFIR